MDNKSNGRKTINLISGDHYVSTNKDEMLVTILGSCVACCIRDPLANVGGMNHFLLPTCEDQSAMSYGSSARFGAYAMEVLINDMIKKGADKSRFEIKIFGGGHVINNSMMIGERNIKFIKDYLSKEGFNIAAEDVGGFLPRKINFFPITGKVMVRQLTTNTHDLISKENVLYNKVSSSQNDGDAELF